MITPSSNPNSRFPIPDSLSRRWRKPDAGRRRPGEYGIGNRELGIGDLELVAKHHVEARGAASVFLMFPYEKWKVFRLALELRDIAAELNNLRLRGCASDLDHVRRAASSIIPRSDSLLPVRGGGKPSGDHPHRFRGATHPPLFQPVPPSDPIRLRLASSHRSRSECADRGRRRAARCRGGLLPDRRRARTSGLSFSS